MKTSNFMSGCCMRSKAQVKYLSLTILMMINTSGYAQDNTLVNNSDIVALDKGLLEFLSFYEVDNGDLLDVAIDEISKSEMSNTNPTDTGASNVNSFEKGVNQ